MKKHKTRIRLTEWYKKNCNKGLDKQTAIRKCSQQTGVTIDNCRRAWNKVYTTTSSMVVPTDMKGLQGFAELHDIDARQKRRDAHCIELIEKFIDGPLQERGWFYDTEAARIAGLTSTDWSRHRDSYAQLQVIVNTDKGKRNTWVHPSLVAEARKIAERS